MKDPREKKIDLSRLAIKAFERFETLERHRIQTNCQ